MSRIRGISAKVQNEVANEILQTRRNECNETNKKRNEDQSICPKDEAEKQQIKELLQKLPKLDKIFSVHRKIGEGTFSSVYLGSLRAHAAVAPAQRRWFALKHLVPTAHPARIEHELRCLRDIGGKNNVIGVDLCLRHFDTIVFVMPYIPHRKFSEYVGEMSADEVREYMRALLTALQHVHSFGVIHRDVKPSNFLYDRESRRYLLVDFGLAQRLVAAPAPPPAHNNNTLKRKREQDSPAPDAKRAALDLSVKRAPVALPAPRRLPLPPPTPKSVVGAGAGAGVGVCVECVCAGVGGVCAACNARPPPRAPRAGTQGFRPPEVLLKVVQQTCAVDMWAAGVVLASLLSARYPFFRAADDAAALAELADLLGTAPLQRAAIALEGGNCPACFGGEWSLCRGVLSWLCAEISEAEISEADIRREVIRITRGWKLSSVLRRRMEFVPRSPVVAVCRDQRSRDKRSRYQEGSNPDYKTCNSIAGRKLVTSVSRHGLCLRKLCARLRGGGGGAHPAPAPAPAPGSPAGLCSRCRLPRVHCLCLDDSKSPCSFTPGAGVVVAGFPDSAFGLLGALLEPDPRLRPTADRALQHPFFNVPP